MPSPQSARQPVTLAPQKCHWSALPRLPLLLRPLLGLVLRAQGSGLGSCRTCSSSCSCSKSRLPNQDSACQGSIRGVCPSSLPLHPHTLTEQLPHVYIRLSSHLFCPSLIPLSSHHPTCSPNTPVTSALTTNHPPTRNPSHPQITNTPPPPKEWICSKDWPKRQSRLPAAVITTTPPQLAPKAPAIRLLVDKRITSTKVCHVSPQIKINTNTITQPDPI